MHIGDEIFQSRCLLNCLQKRGLQYFQLRATKGVGGYAPRRTSSAFKYARVACIPHAHQVSLSNASRSTGCAIQPGPLQHKRSKPSDAENHYTYCTCATCSFDMPVQNVCSIAAGLLPLHTCCKALGQLCWLRLRCTSTSTSCPALRKYLCYEPLST